MSVTESRAIEIFAECFGKLGGGAVSVGMGDDAAVVDFGAGNTVWTIDDQVEGVHFRRHWLDWSAVGYRAVAAAVSDVIAMGAEPKALLCSVQLPESFSESDVRALASGQQQAAAQAGARVVGGNVTGGPYLRVTTTVTGRASRLLLRSGARAGDGLWLVGQVGLARCGLQALMRRDSEPQFDFGHAALLPAVECWRYPILCPATTVAAGVGLTAAIDVSDGLVSEAGHLARASGVEVVLERRLLESVLSPTLRAAAAHLSLDPLDCALFGGEDYCLLVTGSEPVPSGARRIGHIAAGAPVVTLEGEGQRHIVAGGFEHR